MMFTLSCFHSSGFKKLIQNSLLICVLLMGMLEAGKVVAQNSKQPTQFRGVVVDSISREPVESVSVSIRRGDIIKQTTITNENGEFSFSLSNDNIRPDVVISYCGKVTWFLDANFESPSVYFSIATGIELDDCPIWEFQKREDSDFFCGSRWMEETTLTSSRTNCKWNTERRPEGIEISRPLDEWLMMNHSEIHHSGRW